MRSKILASTVLALLLASLPPASTAAVRPGSVQADRKLVILFTNDLHSNILPRKVVGPDGALTEKGGFARLATLIAREKEAAGGAVVVLDSGDFSMGTLFHTLFETEAAELRLLGLMGVEATTLGNHEFDFGLDGLARSLVAAKSKGGPLPAIVASSLGIEGQGEVAEAGRAAFRDFPVRDYLILERAGLRIGVFSFLGEDAADDSPFAGPVAFRDAEAEARRVVGILRGQEKVDLVIGLSHAGTKPDPAASEDDVIAKAVPGIDVLISGHAHAAFESPRMAGRTILVSTGWGGDFLGRLELSPAEAGGARVAAYALLPVSPEVPADPAVATAAGELKSLIETTFLSGFPDGFSQVLAESPFNLDTPEAMEASGLEAGMGNLLADALREAVRKTEGASYQHVAAVIVPVGIVRGTFLMGPITVEDVFRVFSLGLGPDGQPGYPLLSMRLYGRELRHLVEVQASVVPMKSDAALQFSGLRFHYNPHRLPFDRVTDVSVLEEDGSYAPLDRGRLYRIVVDSYTGGMVDYVSKASYGLLKMRARDASGKPLARQIEGAVDADPGAPGLQELKAWKALAGVIRDYPDTDGDAIPNVPERYGKPEGRFGPVPSRGLFSLIVGGGGLTYYVLAAALLILALVILLVRAIVRGRRRRRARRASR